MKIRALSKRCRRCLKTKPISEYYLSHRSDGNIYPASYCRQCSRKMASEYLKQRYRNEPEFREYVKAKTRAWNDAHPNWRARKRAANGARLRKPRRLSRHSHEHRLSRYRLTAVEFETIIAKQKGLCAICQESFPGTPRVDHSHVTGGFRGLLCDRCNRGIGYFKEDPARILAAAEYLKAASKA